MDLSKLKSVRISTNARSKICRDYYPQIEDEIINEDADLNEKHLSMHAGALCLYATTLITKIYDTSPETIKYQAEERKRALELEFKSKPKFANLTDEEIKEKVNEQILKEIRNSFAHGNFEISYDIYTQKLYYILKPKHSTVEEPIIISKDDLLNANRSVMSKISRSFINLDAKRVSLELSSDPGNILKKFLLPAIMLNLSERYLDKKLALQKSYLKIEGYKIKFIQYCLLVSQITYEQDDYYKIFGRDSDLFERISLMRNSIAHDSFEIIDLKADVNYTDRNKNIEEPMIRSVITLNSIWYQKEMLRCLINKGGTEEEIQEIKDGLKEVFDMYFRGEVI